MSIDLYHLAHICCCDKCRGRVWSHSQGDWDGHLRYIPSNLIIDIKPNRLSKDAIKRHRQIKMFYTRLRKQLIDADFE